MTIKKTKTTKDKIILGCQVHKNNLIYRLLGKMWKDIPLQINIGINIATNKITLCNKWTDLSTERNHRGTQTQLCCMQ